MPSSGTLLRFGFVASLAFFVPLGLLGAVVQLLGGQASFVWFGQPVAGVASFLVAIVMAVFISAVGAVAQVVGNLLLRWLSAPPTPVEREFE